MPESKTPNLDEWLEWEEDVLSSAAVERLKIMLAKDLAAIEAKHADELTTAVAEAIKLCHEEHTREIAKARREAYEEIWESIPSFGVVPLTGCDWNKFVNMIGEKAVKL